MWGEGPLPVLEVPTGETVRFNLTSSDVVHSVAVEGTRLAALAAGRPPPPPHEDPDVRAEIEAALAGEPHIAGFVLGPGTPGGAELAIGLRPAPGAAGPALHRAATAIAARLGIRLRRGIQIGVG